MDHDDLHAWLYDCTATNPALAERVRYAGALAVRWSASKGRSKQEARAAQLSACELQLIVETHADWVARQ